MKPIITILSGERNGEKIAVVPSKLYVFGRDETADFSLSDKKISRRHSTLLWSPEEDLLVIEDKSSLNGTFVNGKIIVEPTALKPGDRFQIGTFLFEITSQERAEEATPLPLSPEELISQEFEEVAPTGILRHTDSEAISHENKDEPHYEFNPATDGTALTGNLREIPLPDLLQMLASMRRSGKLVIVQNKKDLRKDPPKGSAILWIDKGSLIAADVGGFSSEKAFYEVLRWQMGYFSLFYKDVSLPSPQINLPLEALLLEGIRLLDEEKTMSVAFKPTDEFEVRLDEPLTSLDANQLRIFQTAWKKKRVADIRQTSHLDAEKTDILLRELMRLGYLKKKI